MKNFRKKQKRLYKIMKPLIIFSAVFIFIFIGVQPYIAQFNSTLDMILRYLCDFLVIGDMCVIFAYYSRYGKTDSFLNTIEHEISDAGYYYSSRNECDVEAYTEAVFEDLKSTGYSVDKNIEIDDFDFSVRAMKKNEFFYVPDCESVDKNDIVAYLDAVIRDITVTNIKRKGDAALCFICNNAEENAIALSKMITPVGKKEQLKIAISIANVNTKKVYFLGNMDTKCRRIIANYVMNCDIPIKDKYIGNEKLSFQNELEERMKSFNLKDYKNGNFYAHL